MQGAIYGRGGANYIATVMQQILNDITYTGTMESSLKPMNGRLYALLTFKTSGTLTVNGNYTGDVFLCGGGGGSSGHVGDTYVSGNHIATYSGGGGGGYTTNAYGVSIVSGDIEVGAGGQFSGYGYQDASDDVANGGNTTAFGASATGGKGPRTWFDDTHARPHAYGIHGGPGGSGGGGGCHGEYNIKNPGQGGTGQGTSTKPFLCEDMLPTGAGGGGNCSTSYDHGKGGDGGSDGSNGSPGVPGGESTIQGIGGYYGGGSGGYTRISGSYYGAGGGGIYVSTMDGHDNGAPRGYPGVVMVRILV